MHEQPGIEARAVSAFVPSWRILHDSLKCFCPAMLYAECHCVGQKLLECVGRHALQPVGIDAIHELLETENLDAGAYALHAARRHNAGKQNDDDYRKRNRAEHPQPGLSEVNMEEISSENKWSSGDHSAENPVGVCALGIERV